MATFKLQNKWLYTLLKYIHNVVRLYHQYYTKVQITSKQVSHNVELFTSKMSLNYLALVTIQ